MAYQIAQTISDPGTAPQRTDPDNFDTRADAFLTVLSLWGAATTGELIVLTAQMNALSTAVDGYSTDAETAQTAAEAAQAAAEAASGATEWLIGTTYDDGDVTWGSDSKTYRAAQGSNTGHDPVGDDGTWWVQISGAEIGANSDITSMTGLSDNGIPLAKVANAASDGANADITSMTGLSDDGIPHAKIADLQGNKNAIINGDFNIWQRGTSFAAIANTAYSADRFQYVEIGDAVHTVSRDTDVPTQAESGHKSNYSLKVDCTTVDASIGAADFDAILYNIEGYDIAPFIGNTATLSFWVKAVKTGIYCVSFRNSGSNRSYVVEYTINSASTWEKKTATLVFSDTGGTWDYINGTGLIISWTLAAGTNYQAVADGWRASYSTATSNQVNGVDSTDNNFWLAQVQFELGSTATDFEYRQYGDELARCQRYAFVPELTTYSVVGLGWATQTTNAQVIIPMAQTMRAIPSVTGTAADYQIGDGTADYAVTVIAISGSQSSVDSVTLTVTVASGLTQFRPCIFRADGTGGRIIIFSSEL